MPLLDMANLFNSFRLMVCSGLVSILKRNKKMLNFSWESLSFMKVFIV
jgi:hypothetical protein